MRTLMRTLLLSVLIVIVSNTLVFAAEGNPPIEQPGSQIGTNGGRIDQATMPELKQYGLDNLSIELSEGCVKQQIRLQINLPTDIPAERAAIRAVEFTVEGHENGFAFNKPVTIEIPYPEDVPDETPLTLMYWNRESESWEEIEFPGSIVRNSERHVVRAQVNHFSIYGVMDLSTPTLVKNANEPQELNLLQNYPNPFNPVTTISYQVLVPSHVTIDVYNIVGQLVTNLVNEDMPVGKYNVMWDSTDQTGSQMTSGVYFCRMKAANYSQTRKLILMK